MFEFFLALFGGSYYYGKCCQESRAKQKSDARINDYMNKFRMVSDTEKIGRLRSVFAADPHREIEQISDELYYIFSDYDWRELYKYPFFEQYDLNLSNGFFSIWQIAYAVYLAKNGCVWSYLEFCASPIYKMLGLFDQRNEQLARQIVRRTCVIIDKCLRAKYGDNDDDLRLRSPGGYGNSYKLGLNTHGCGVEYETIYYADFDVKSFADRVKSSLANQHASA